MIFFSIFDGRFEISGGFAIHLISNTIYFWKRKLSFYFIKLAFISFFMVHMQQAAKQPMSLNLKLKVSEKIVTKRFNKNAQNLYHISFKMCSKKDWVFSWFCTEHTTRTPNLKELETHISTQLIPCSGWPCGTLTEAKINPNWHICC